MKFSRHNVILPDGSDSAPGRPVLVESPPFQSLLRLLDFIFKNTGPQDISIADLGCMEGGISIELARRGYRVTGIEARERHIERCEFLKERFDLANVRFINDRVENLEQYGPFDFIFASGILYHLKNPVEFIGMLGRASNRAILLNTHFAEERIPSRFRHKLGGMTRHEDRRGRWYSEWPKNTPPEKIAKQERTAVGNRMSFWLRKDELLEVVRNNFDLVFELFDGHYTMEKAFTAMRRNSRGTFVGIKSQVSPTA